MRARYHNERRGNDNVIVRGGGERKKVVPNESRKWASSFLASLQLVHTHREKPFFIF